MQLDGRKVTLGEFLALLDAPEPISITPALQNQLDEDATAVACHANADKPVYGLTTGLGANLGHRLTDDEASAFQAQIITGRNVATGPALPPEIGRGILLARIISASNGGSGLSPALFAHLCKLFGEGFAPDIPQWGSIGASDLTQNAAFAAAVIAHNAPPLGPKDGLGLINHSGLTVALSGTAIGATTKQLTTLRAIIALTLEAYGANPAIFDTDVNALRPAPGQAEAAAWFRDALKGAANAQHRIQDALSLRTVAPVLGAAQAALDHATSVYEDELNGLPDSPAVLSDGRMLSTPNFANPALTLALGTLSQALSMLASGSVQRIQRLMNTDLTGLPKYLSPIGGASAGMVPLQKTAAALLSEIQMIANAPIIDASPVSDTVEDVAPMTPQAAQKLARMAPPLRLLAAIEAMVSAQALDLRDLAVKSENAKNLHKAIRSVSAMLTNDRALGPEIEAIASVLDSL